MGDTAYHAGGDSVANSRKHDRDRGSRFLDGTDKQRRRGHNHIWLQPHEFRRERRNGLGSSCRGPVDEGDVVTLDITQVAHALAEGVEMLWKPRVKDPDLGKCRLLLRVRRE